MPAAPTVATGIRSTLVGVASARRVIDMRDTIYDYDANATPLLTILTKRAARVAASSPEFNHLEDQPLPWWDTLNGAIVSTSATTVVVTNGAYFRAGDIVLIPTSTLTGGEYMLVSSVATNTLTVVRDWVNANAGTGGTALTGSYITIIGNVNEENATVRQIKSTTESKVTNYTQIIRTPFGGSNTLQASNLYGGKERPRLRRKFMAQHNFECERAFLYGKKRETTGANGHALRSTGGILSWLTTNVTNVNGTLTDATLESFSETLFRYGSGSKLVVGSRRFATQLDMIAAGRIQTRVGQDTYGVAVKEFMSSHGRMMVVIDDMLANDYAGFALALDMEYLLKRYLSDDSGSREARLNTNIQDPSADGWVDEYLSEIGLHVIMESCHGVLKGIA